MYLDAPLPQRTEDLPCDAAGALLLACNCDRARTANKEVETVEGKISLENTAAVRILHRQSGWALKTMFYVLKSVAVDLHGRHCMSPEVFPA